MKKLSKYVVMIVVCYVAFAVLAAFRADPINVGAKLGATVRS